MRTNGGNSVQRFILLIAAIAVAWTASFAVAPAGDVMMRFFCWVLVMVAILAAYSAGRKLERATANTPTVADGTVGRPVWQFTLRAK